jgi:hypothetical protein
MKKIRDLIIVFVIGLIVGIGLGINIGKDKPLLSNPFSQRSLKQHAKKTGEKILEKGGEVLEEKLKK